MSSPDGSVRDASQAIDSTKTAWHRAHVAFGFFLLLWAVLYSSSLQTMVRAWWDTGTYQYAFLIFPIVVWLVWSRRRVTAIQPLAFTGWAIAGIAGASLLWLLGALVSVNVVEHFSIVAMLPFLVLACYGRHVAKSLMFPLGYLFFAVPWGNFLVGPLRTVTARISVRLLQLSGATVFLNGHLIEVPVGSFEVADACSGIKFFIATTALGTLYAYLFYRSWRRRLIFILAALVVPIIANGLRVYFTILIGQTFGMQYATGTDHMIFGWQFFGSVLVLLFLAGWYWRQDPVSATPDMTPPIPTVPRSKTPVVAIAAFIGLLIGPIGAGVMAPAAPRMVVAKHWPARSLERDHTTVTVGTQGASVGTRFTNADAYLQATYRQGDLPVSVYIAQYYGVPQHGHEVLDFGNRIYGKRWRVLGQQARVVQGRPVTQLDLRFGSRQILVWYWYQVDGAPVTSPVAVKLLQLWERVDGSPSQAAVICLSSPATVNSSVPTERVLHAFYERNFMPIRKLLDGRN